MFVHGDNLLRKEEEYANDSSKMKLLNDIRKKYDAWKKANEDLKGPFADPSDNDNEIIKERTKLFNDYKDFIDQKVYALAFD